MALEKLPISKNNVSFFSRHRPAINLENSLIAKLIEVCLISTIIEVALATTPPNPYIFMLNTLSSCLYALTSSPIIKDSKDYKHAWSAYQAIVDMIVDKKFGPSTQVVDGAYYKIKEQLWSAEVCEATIKLESNCTRLSASPFIIDFINRVENLTEISQAKKCFEWPTYAIAIGAGVGGAALLACCGFVAYFLYFAVKICHSRSKYDQIYDQDLRSINNSDSSPNKSNAMQPA